MKGLLSILIIIFFPLNVVAEEIIMKCKSYRYKYVSDDLHTIVYSANIKRDKKKYHKFCPSGIDDSNKHFLKSAEGVELLITNHKAICSSSKLVFLNGGIGTESISVTDFKKLIRVSEYKRNGKAQKQTEKCKLEK